MSRFVAKYVYFPIIAIINNIRDVWYSGTYFSSMNISLKCVYDIFEDIFSNFLLAFFSNFNSKYNVHLIFSSLIYIANDE